MAQLETIEDQLVDPQRQLAQATARSYRAVRPFKARIGELSVARSIVDTELLTLDVDS